MRIGWAGTDAGSGVAGYDVDYRVARWDTPLGPWLRARSATYATALTIASRPGREYCWRARARDRAGNVSAWTPQRCTAVVVDDRYLSATGPGWRRGTTAGYYRSTWTGTQGTTRAAVRLAGVWASRLALVITTCARCGPLRVYVDGRLVQTVATYSVATRHRVVVLGPRVRLGRHTVSLHAAGSRPVRVDGLAPLQ